MNKIKLFIKKINPVHLKLNMINSIKILVENYPEFLSFITNYLLKIQFKTKAHIVYRIFVKLAQSTKFNLKSILAVILKPNLKLYLKIEKKIKIIFRCFLNFFLYVFKNEILFKYYIRAVNIKQNIFIELKNKIQIHLKTVNNYLIKTKFTNILHNIFKLFLKLQIKSNLNLKNKYLIRAKTNSTIKNKFLIIFNGIYKTFIKFMCSIPIYVKNGLKIRMNSKYFVGTQITIIARSIRLYKVKEKSDLIFNDFNDKPIHEILYEEL